MKKKKYVWKIIVIVIFTIVILLLVIDFTLALIETIKQTKNVETKTWAVELTAQVIITLALGFGIRHIRGVVAKQ